MTVSGWVLLGAAGVAAVGGAGFGVYAFARGGEVFRVQNLEAVEVVNNEHVSTAAVREVFAGDVGGSIFLVPLEARRQSAEELTWVEGAAVQRVLPNRLRVQLRERVPVAFLRQRASLALVDAAGVLLPLPESADYAFPVLTGLSDGLSREERRARVGFYLEFITDMDRGGKGYSGRFSEVDVSDADNLRATVTEDDGAVWLHFGRDRYQEKFEAFLEHRALWKKSGEAVRSVDLRYRGQIVLNPESAGTAGR